MERARVIRGVKIAWTVWWGILGVLLLALWVRTRFAVDSVAVPLLSDAFVITSRQGGIGVGYASQPPLPQLGWQVYPPATTRDPDIPAKSFEFYRDPRGNFFAIRSPYWFLVPTIALIGASPWLRWKFSLRTLLIATTLIAVLLATAAYLRGW